MFYRNIAISIIFLISLFAFGGCTELAANASSESEVSNPDQYIVESSPQTALPTTPPPSTATPEITQIPRIKMWISQSVPDGMIDRLGVPSVVDIVNSPQDATVIIDVYRAGKNDGVYFPASWTYVLVAPFPTVLDGVNLDDILLAWQGWIPEVFQNHPILMSASTRSALESWWGRPASEEGVKVVEKDKILDAAWVTQPSWAIIPFEDLSPRWKVLRINGISPLDRNADTWAQYPLIVNYGMYGDTQGIQSLERLAANGTIEVALTNRDPEKMAIVLLTGTTALVRETALRMEEEGVTYPAANIAHWLREADIAHISNEVPFDPNCPPAKPLRREARFCSAPNYFELFEYAGIDLVELTGNHLLDWGPEPMRYTLDLYRQKGMPYYGGGYNLEEGRKPYIVEINGNKLAFIGCNAMGPESDWATDKLPGSASCDLNWMESEIRRLSTEGYLPIVTFQHFEVCEFKPQSDQRFDFPRMAQAGAVIVSGSQSHCPQAMTLVGEHFVHYGLGNLWFDQMDAYASREFLDRHVFYNGRYISTELLTAQLENGARPRPMTEKERGAFLNEVFQACSW